MPTIHCKHLIFDLDGTLIDSAPSILACFAKVLEQAGVAPRVPLEERLIGPPLAQTLQTLSGIRDDAAIAAMIESFKAHYDTKGYRETVAYAGIAEALAELKAAGFGLVLATNKRIQPTRLILEHLGWAGLFDSVWALDSFEPKLGDKTAMLRAVLQRLAIEPAHTAYIGDKAEDGWATQANTMPFVAARWGYGAFQDTPGHWLHLDAPRQLPSAFVRWQG